jgi:mannose-6-phosphate isomerase-like protein (cupin superfamily)
MRSRTCEPETREGADDEVDQAPALAQAIRLHLLWRDDAGISVILADVSYTIFKQSELAWEARGDDSGRTIAPLSDALTQSRANIWRYPPGARGKRHLDRGQEEVFVVLDGTLTVDLGEPPERHELPRGSVLAVETGTILQLRNVGSEEVVLFIYGAPPVTGQGEFFPDVP